MFKIEIQGSTMDELKEKLRDHIKAIDAPLAAYKASTAEVAHTQPDQAAPKEVAVEPPRPPSPAPAAASPAVPAPSTTEATAAPSEQAPAADPDKLLGQIRAVLGPLMADPKRAADVTALVEKFGGKLSKVAPEKLAELLSAAQALAGNP